MHSERFKIINVFFLIGMRPSHCEVKLNRLCHKSDTSLSNANAPHIVFYLVNERHRTVLNSESEKLTYRNNRYFSNILLCFCRSFNLKIVILFDAFFCDLYKICENVRIGQSDIQILYLLPISSPF